MKPSFALILSFEDVHLLHRSTYGWTTIAQIPLSSAEIETEIAHQLETAVRLDLHGVSTVLVIPESEVKCLKVPIGDTPPEKFEEYIISKLGDATPYPLSALVIDWIVEDDNLLVVAVARETLDQFENFAVKYKFNPISYSAVLKGEFKNFVPFFGQTKFAETFLDGEQVEPEIEPVFAKKSTSMQFKKRPASASSSRPSPSSQLAPAKPAAKELKPDPGDETTLISGVIARFWEHSNKVHSPVWRFAIGFAVLLAVILVFLFLWVLASPNMSIKQLFTASYSVDTALEENESGLYDDLDNDILLEEIFPSQPYDEMATDSNDMLPDNSSSDPFENERVSYPLRNQQVSTENTALLDNSETALPSEVLDNTASIDPKLTEPPLVSSEEVPAPSQQQSAPQRQETQALPEDTDEVQIIEGKPAIIPAPRPKGISVIATTYFNALQPRKRPDSELTETIERLRYGGMTYKTLASITPPKRPLSEQERALLKLGDTSAREYAIALSQIPVPRAANLKKQAERIIAERNKAQVSISRKSSLSLGQSATQRNVLALDQASLIGVLGTTSGRQVLVRFPNGRIVKLSVGDRLQSGRIDSIAETSMKYTKSGKTFTLKMPGI